MSAKTDDIRILSEFFQVIDQNSGCKSSYIFLVSFLLLNNYNLFNFYSYLECSDQRLAINPEICLPQIAAVSSEGATTTDGIEYSLFV